MEVKNPLSSFPQERIMKATGRSNQYLCLFFPVVTVESHFYPWITEPKGLKIFMCLDCIKRFPLTNVVQSPFHHSNFYDGLKKDYDNGNSATTVKPLLPRKARSVPIQTAAGWAGLLHIFLCYNIASLTGWATNTV